MTSQRLLVQGTLTLTQLSSEMPIKDERPAMFGQKWLESWPQRVWWTLCGLLAIAFAGANIAGKLKVALYRHGIIPDVMMSAPKLGIYVAHGKRYTAKFGNPIPIEFTGQRPTTIKWKTLDNAVYTLIAMDIDAVPLPSRFHELELERLLWMIVNIPAGHNVNVTTGETLAPYVGPVFEKIHNKSEDHRIVYLVFDQPGGNNINFTFPILDDKPDNPKRCEFNVHKFVDEYKLGLPIAINFYITREGLLVTTVPPPKKERTPRYKGPKTTTPEPPVVTAERIDDIDYVDEI